MVGTHRNFIKRSFNASQTLHSFSCQTTNLKLEIRIFAVGS